jgi:hypothetical protein
MIWGAIGLDYKYKCFHRSHGADSNEYQGILPRSELVENLNGRHGAFGWYFIQDGGIHLPSESESIEPNRLLEIELVVEMNAWYLWTCQLAVPGKSLVDQPWRGDPWFAHLARTMCSRSRFVGCFDEVLGISLMHVLNWHHFMLQTIAFLLWVPSHIRNASFFVFPRLHVGLESSFIRAYNFWGCEKYRVCSRGSYMGTTSLPLLALSEQSASSDIITSLYLSEAARDR